MSDHPDRSQPITDIGPGDLGGGDKENNIPSNNLQGGDEQRVVHPVSNIPDPTQLQAQAQLQQQEPHGQVQQELQRQQIQDLVQQELQRQQQRLMQPTGTSSTSYRPQAEPNFGRVIKTFRLSRLMAPWNKGRSTQEWPRGSHASRPYLKCKRIFTKYDYRNA
ncbi:hypothetical protein PF011_g5453 [Phytophthora fragariae]|uniref:Uncharacterized protein n=1 Tax=Phytophthora fragariae TaxID=53985 RepID=A0A6A3LVQ0_9STRA|nr:hypothetical protein PF011_g5453 [Phytophthora fragariae]